MNNKIDLINNTIKRGLRHKKKQIKELKKFLEEDNQEINTSEKEYKSIQRIIKSEIIKSVNLGNHYPDEGINVFNILRQFELGHRNKRSEFFLVMDYVINLNIDASAKISSIVDDDLEFNHIGID